MAKRMLSRRQILKTAAIGALSRLVPDSALRLKAQGDGVETVLIIGAGVAGLTAARLLHDDGYNVTVLEGRDRIGGRLWTNRDLDGLPLDMGASWIHGTDGNPLTALADEVDVERVVTDSDNLALYDAEGDAFGEDDIATYEALHEALMARAAEIAEESDIDMSLRAAITQALNEAGADLDDTDLLVLGYIVNTTVEHEYAASVDVLSSWNWDSDDGFGGDDVLFPDGYDWLIRMLSQGLNIHLNTPIHEIRYNDNGVEVVSDDAAFSADYAVITLPLGVLKAGVVSFAPPLPADKLRALTVLQMGILNKVYLQFEEAFWDVTVDSIGYVSAEHGEWAEIVNFVHVVDAPVLLCFNAATFGLALEDMSDTEIVERAMTTLRTIYGDAISEPVGVLITRWGKDPFSYGSYSAYGVDSSVEDRMALAAPLNDTLFFAGEATHSQYPATIHGALLSGQRAAEEIMAL